MKLRIIQKTIDKWISALIHARAREIGGVLFGEHLGVADFKIVEATIHEQNCNEDTFLREVNKARCDLKVLSNQHGDKPEQFNYLGEWHSHPNAPVTPSVIDEITMRELLDDPETTVNFLVLLINRLNESGMLEIFASAYLASGHKIPCEIILEPNKLTS